MTDLEIHMYAQVRAVTDPNVRIRWGCIGPCDWQKDLWPAYFEFWGQAVMDIPGQAIKGDNE